MSKKLDTVFNMLIEANFVEEAIELYETLSAKEDKAHPRFEHALEDVRKILNKLEQAGKEVPGHTGKIVRKLDAIESELNKLLVSLGRYDLSR